jgi:hypothetical protein
MAAAPQSEVLITLLGGKAPKERLQAAQLLLESSHPDARAAVDALAAYRFQRMTPTVRRAAAFGGELGRGRRERESPAATPRPAFPLVGADKGRKIIEQAARKSFETRMKKMDAAVENIVAKQPRRPGRPPADFAQRQVHAALKRSGYEKRDQTQYWNWKFPGIERPGQ